MFALSVIDVLDAWERGSAQTPAQRALTLLASAYPETTVDALARLSIGQRDDRLLTLREWMFGSRVESIASCPACRAQLELDLTVANIRVTSDTAPEETLSTSVDGYEVRFRLPDSTDLLALEGQAGVEDGRRLLLARCLQSVRREKREVDVEQLPSGVIASTVSRMAEADPQANAELPLNCPACEHHWAVAFDIASFLWHEIDTWARRLLYEVHQLASAYGWSEADILALSPGRRQFYLDMTSA